MTHDQVLILDAIVTYGTFREASSRLHKSQPSLTMAIKKLEAELGFELFSREDYRPKLTSRGRVFHEKSKAVIASMRKLSVLGEELASDLETSIDLGIDALIPMNGLFEYLNDFFKDYPYTNLNLGIETLQGTLEKLECGDIQIGITPILYTKPEFEMIPLSSLTLIPVIHRDLLPANSDLVENFQAIPQIISKSTATLSNLSAGILEGGRHWTVSESSFKKELILKGLGWGGLPEYLIKEELKDGKLIPINVPGIVTRTIEYFLVRHSQKPMGEVTKKLWKYIQNFKFDEYKVR